MSRLTTFVAMVSLGFASKAAESPEPFAPDPVVSNTVERYLGDRGQVTSYFLAPMGLIGVGVSLHAGPKLVIYASADGRYLISGALVDTTSGENLSQTATEALEHNDNGKEGMWAALASAHYLERPGRGEPIYVLVDTRCSFCHSLARRLAKVAQGRLIRWVLVGYQGVRSSQDAALLLGMDQRMLAEQRLRQAMETGTAIAYEEGASDLASGQRKLTENESLAERLRLFGTPQLVTRLDGQLRIVRGSASETELAAVLGTTDID